MVDDPYTTPIKPDDQVRYQLWRAQLPKNLQNDEDYDLQGAYMDGLKPTANEHFNDKYKKPNHITFSDQSMYSTPDNPGGSWVGDDETGGTFWASPANLQYHSIPEMQQYFNENEPKWNVVFPSQYQLPNTQGGP
jgi:hypothetical protein